MSYTRRLIISCCLLFASSAHALEPFVDGLYWRATETIDWSLTNNLDATNQQISYQTIDFNFDPGFRAGVAYNSDWYSKLYYTYYYTKAISSVTGNVVTAFLGGKIVQTPNSSIFFFRTGQISFKINYNVVDWDLGKTFHPTDKIMLRPILGLRAAWIDQTVNTSFQGPISMTEDVKNNFKGFGPKAALETKWQVYKFNNYQFNLFGDFTGSLLWGKWDISDVVHDTAGLNIYTNVGNRNLGALTLQAFMGLNFDYKRFTIKLGYEIADWFDQYQVIDDGTGARNSDLILQGLTLRLAYCF